MHAISCVVSSFNWKTTKTFIKCVSTLFEEKTKMECCENNWKEERKMFSENNFLQLELSFGFQRRAETVGAEIVCSYNWLTAAENRCSARSAVWYQICVSLAGHMENIVVLDGKERIEDHAFGSKDVNLILPPEKQQYASDCCKVAEDCMHKGIYIYCVVQMLVSQFRFMLTLFVFSDCRSF